MTKQQQTRQINLVRVVGTLDTQTVSRRDAAQLPGVITGNGRNERPRATLTRRFNEVQGTEQRAVLQVPSPFGKPFQIALHLEGGIEGRELLETSEPGTLLAADGELEWVQTTDPRYAVDATDRGRRASELIFRARAVRLAGDADEPGCDVWLEGSVLTTSRVLRHPDRPVLIAVTTVRVNVERTRKGSRARLSEPANVAIAIPVDHPEAPNLLRQGNQVVIEGMLERYVVPLRGAEVDRAVAALDETWSEEQSGLSSPRPAATPSGATAASAGASRRRPAPASSPATWSCSRAARPTSTRPRSFVRRASAAAARIAGGGARIGPTGSRQALPRPLPLRSTLNHLSRRRSPIMAKPHDNPEATPLQPSRIRLKPPGTSGGLTEFIHALAAILARLDAEQRGRVQSDSPQDPADQRKESP